MKEKIIIIKNNHKYNKNTHFEGCTRQSYLALIHLSQRLASPIFTVAPLWYFSGCFPLVFLEGYCPSSFLTATSLYLDPVIWNLSALFNRAVSSSSTLFWSHWRYSNILFFFFSSSTTLCLLAFSWAFFSASLLVF